MPNTIEIQIREYSTPMSDGSVSVICMTEHNGQKIAAGYNITAQEAMQKIDEIDLIVAPRRERAHAAIRDKVAELVGQPALEVVPESERAGEMSGSALSALQHAAAGTPVTGDNGLIDVPPADKQPE